MNDVHHSEVNWAVSVASTEATGTPRLGALLHDIRAFILKYVVLTSEQAATVALWAAHTHVIKAFECTPYLQIASATKRAGKTRLLEALEPLVARPWLTGRMSAAVLVRKVDAETPTLLLDESDAAFKGDKDYAEALRGILNSGYRKSGKASLCVGQGGNISYKDFATFGAKAIAGIGDLPDTIADRSIRIELRRRTSDEPCTRWRERDGREEAGPIFRGLVAWAQQADTVSAIGDARPELPAALGDRQADVWEALFAIADAAGGEWPAAARKAAVVLAGTVEDQDIIVELLTDIREAVADYQGDAIASKELLERLTAAEDRPWATWRHDKPITARGLARLLGPLGIHPSDQRVIGRHRSYRIDAFRDAFTRYLPIQVGKRESLNKYGEETPISKRDTHADEPTLNFADSANVSAGDPTCPLETVVPSDQGDASDF